MATNIKRQMLQGVNKLISFSGIELVRKGKTFQDYIPLKITLAAAEGSGMSLCDYIDTNFNVPGTTQKTIDKMAELGVFSGKINKVCEIGPGSGRYLEKVIEVCHPEHYEIYETSQDWREWLVDKYKVVAQPADGVSLSSTPSNSMDLIHTHKMLYGNPIVTIYQYLFEMIRVVRDGGFVVFDLVTEDCLEEEIVQKWISSGVDHACSMTSKKLAMDFFSKRGFEYLGGFIVPMAPGLTEYFVFQKSARS